jgi:outer membrane lipoprotein SlyB
MRNIVLATAVAVILGGCATSPNSMTKAGLSHKQQASDRSHCYKMGEASKRAAGYSQKREDAVTGAVVGSFIGGGLIGGIVAIANKDNIAKNVDTNQTNSVARACLERKGYQG